MGPSLQMPRSQLLKVLRVFLIGAPVLAAAIEIEEKVLGNSRTLKREGEIKNGDKSQSLVVMESPTKKPTRQMGSSFNTVTRKPTRVPSSQPSEDICEAETTLLEPIFSTNLTTTSTFDPYGGVGTMFYVKPLEDVSITGFTMFSNLETEDQVEIYTRKGLYKGYEGSEDGWTLVYNRTVDLMGGQVPTDLGELDTFVDITMGCYQSFFIWTPGKLAYNLGTTEGALFASNEALEFYEGIGMTSKFPLDNGEFIDWVAPRVWRGTIWFDYSLFTPTPSQQPSSSVQPTSIPSRSPSSSPSASPTSEPSISPSASPSDHPTTMPSMTPTRSTNPTSSPSSEPSDAPSASPTAGPTKSPSTSPTASPTENPTDSPTQFPTKSPSTSPTISPTQVPSFSSAPSSIPSETPTGEPSSSPSLSTSPTQFPTSSPTKRPTRSPTESPTSSPTTSPTDSPTWSPTAMPSVQPSSSASPSSLPSSSPSTSSLPTLLPSHHPTASPSSEPSLQPTLSLKPSKLPSLQPSFSAIPSFTTSPSTAPSNEPSFEPSSSPSLQPTSTGTVALSTFEMVMHTTDATKLDSMEELKEIINLFLFDGIRYELPSKYNFKELSLDMVIVQEPVQELVRRREQENTYERHFLLTGYCVFVSDLKPTKEVVARAMENVFASDKLEACLALLRIADDPILRSTLGIEMKMLVQSSTVSAIESYDEVTPKSNQQTLYIASLAIASVCVVGFVAAMFVVRRRRVGSQTIPHPPSGQLVDQVDDSVLSQMEEENGQLPGKKQMNESRTGDAAIDDHSFVLPPQKADMPPSSSSDSSGFDHIEIVEDGAVSSSSEEDIEISVKNDMGKIESVAQNNAKFESKLQDDGYPETESEAAPRGPKLGFGMSPSKHQSTKRLPTNSVEGASTLKHSKMALEVSSMRCRPNKRARGRSVGRNAPQTNDSTRSPPPPSKQRKDHRKTKADESKSLSQNKSARKARSRSASKKKHEKTSEKAKGILPNDPINSPHKSENDPLSLPENSLKESGTIEGGQTNPSSMNSDPTQKTEIETEIETEAQSEFRELYLKEKSKKAPLWRSAPKNTSSASQCGGTSVCDSVKSLAEREAERRKNRELLEDKQKQNFVKYANSIFVTKNGVIDTFHEDEEYRGSSTESC